MKTVAALSLAGLLGAQAFVAPAPKFSRARGVARMSFEGEAGVTAPLGYWVSQCVPCLGVCGARVMVGAVPCEPAVGLPGWVGAAAKPRREDRRLKPEQKPQQQLTAALPHIV